MKSLLVIGVTVFGNRWLMQTVNMLIGLRVCISPHALCQHVYTIISAYKDSITLHSWVWKGLSVFATLAASCQGDILSSDYVAIREGWWAEIAVASVRRVDVAFSKTSREEAINCADDDGVMILLQRHQLANTATCIELV